MGEIKFDESQVVMIHEKLDQKEVFKKLADLLNEKGYTKDSYYEAICEREKAFPTGLYTEGINVAIPHCDVKNVNEAAICVGVLEQPAQFARMDDPEAMIDVQLVVMLALKEAHGHIGMLQKVISLIQNQEVVRQMIESKDKKVIYETIKKYLF